jgi:antitoxin YqcF
MMMSVNWGECYYEHFEHFLGSIFDREIFRQDDNLPSIQILSYDKVFKECRVFCSLGLSHYASEIAGTAEVYLPTDDGWSDTPYLLASALFFMIQSHMTIGWGLSIGGIDRILPQFAKDFNKTAIYLTNTFGLPNDFSKVRCGEEIGNIYLAIFISEAERDYFIQRGAEAFEVLLESNKVDPFSLRRSSCI